MLRLVASLLAVISLSVLLGACGGTAEYSVVGRDSASGADGTVTVEEIAGGNRLVTVALKFLPPPDRITPGATVYVAWFETANQPAIRAGALEFDADARTGNVTATTPSPRFKLKITAERNANVATPSEFVVAELNVTPED